MSRTLRPVTVEAVVRFQIYATDAHCGACPFIQNGTYGLPFQCPLFGAPDEHLEEQDGLPLRHASCIAGERAPATLTYGAIR